LILTNQVVPTPHFDGLPQPRPEVIRPLLFVVFSGFVNMDYCSNN